MAHVDFTVSEEREKNRRRNGEFGTHVRTDPHMQVVPFAAAQHANLEAEAAAWGEFVGDAVGYINEAMPEAAEVVTFDFAPGVAYLEVVEGYDQFGDDIEPSQFANINEALRMLKAPDENYDRELLEREDGMLGWQRLAIFNEAAAQLALTKFTVSYRRWRQINATIQAEALREIIVRLPSDVHTATFDYDELGLLCLKGMRGNGPIDPEEHGESAQQIQQLSGFIDEPESLGLTPCESGGFTLRVMERPASPRA